MPVDTLAEFAKLETDKLKKGVLLNILTANEMNPMLKFKSFTGNAFVYNRESVLPTSNTHTQGDTWESTEPQFTKNTAVLAIVGTQGKLDLYVEETRNSEQSPMGILVDSMGKSLGRKIADKIITGNPGSESTDFEGLTSLAINDQRLLMADDGTTPSSITGSETELVLDRLDAMIDMIKDGEEKPDALVMNITMRRKLTSLARAAGSGVILNEIDSFGRKVLAYDGIPIVINNYITNSEQYENAGGWGSSTATTIFAIQFGEEKQGYTILHNGPVASPRMRELGVKRDEESKEFRMVVYLQGILLSKFALAGLAGIDSAA